MAERTLLSMTAPLREDFAIPYHDIGDPQRRPRAAFVAGVSGTEINGIFVLARLASFLANVAAGGHPTQQLTERVLVVPAVNLLGVNTRSGPWPFDRTNINRMFPGYDAGETTQRVAWALLSATRDAHYRIDVRSSNLDFEELPQVRLYEPRSEEREDACLFGLPAVIERPINRLYTSTLTYAWRAYGGENFVVQAGQAGYLQRHHSERLFRALVAFLQRTGILRGPELSQEEEDLHYFGPRQAVPLLAERAGMFVSRLDVGVWIQAGDVIGHIYDAFDGSIRAEVRAPVAGLLTGLRRQPLLCQGDLMARLHTLRPVADIHDEHLHDQGQ